MKNFLFLITLLIFGLLFISCGSGGGGGGGSSSDDSSGETSASSDADTSSSVNEDSSECSKAGAFLSIISEVILLNAFKFLI